MNNNTLRTLERGINRAIQQHTTDAIRWTQDAVLAWKVLTLCRQSRECPACAELLHIPNNAATGFYVCPTCDEPIIVIHESERRGITRLPDAPDMNDALELEHIRSELRSALVRLEKLLDYEEKS